MKTTIVIALTLSAIWLAIYSYPASAVCIVANGNGHSDTQSALLEQARARIESKFGSLISQPTVYFFDDEEAYWPLSLNSYGSGSFLGYKTCLAVGPNGQNVDVVAHELMHAEIEARTGFWHRTVTMPVWFEEGLAMQVDYRERYILPENYDTEYVANLFSGRDFFAVKGNRLTQNYGAAKTEVNAWLSKETGTNVFQELSKMKGGASFDSVWKNTE